MPRRAAACILICVFVSTASAWRDAGGVEPEEEWMRDSARATRGGQGTRGGHGSRLLRRQLRAKATVLPVAPLPKNSTAPASDPFSLRWLSPPEGRFLVKPSVSFNPWSVEGNSTANGGTIALSAYPNGFDFNVGGLWSLSSKNGSFQFKETLQNKCLDIPVVNKLAGVQLIQSDCANSSTQLWQPLFVRPYDAAVQWQSVSAKLCLESDGSASSKVVLRACLPTTSGAISKQLWLPAALSTVNGKASSSGLTFPDVSASITFGLNAFSRHASLVVTTPPASSDWRLVFSNDTNDQSSCGSCSIFGVVASVEGLYNILYNPRVPVSLSEQQVLDCNGSCAGVWPERSMQYLVGLSAGLAGAADYGGYTAVEAPCKAAPGTARVVAYEQVPALSPPALVAALSAQPVVAYMVLTDDFVAWSSWAIFTDASKSCVPGAQLSHVVTLVGYGSENAVDFWIVRNSFGSSWGVNGYARILRNICGIGTMPSIYPVMASPNPNPCLPLNPCGGGVCTPSGAAYTCACPSGYAAVRNTDGTQTCAATDVCGAAVINPCSGGTCVNDGGGSYRCVCVAGYVLASTSEGKPICVTPAQTSNSQPFNYTLLKGDTCKLLALANGLTVKQLQAANPTINCPTLRVGDVITIPTPSKCTSMYAVQIGDTCASIEVDLNLTPGSLSKDLNPGLDCLDPNLAGQQVCVERGVPDDSRICSSVDAVVAGDVKKKRCNSLVKRSLMTVRQFFALNRGINCNNLVPAMQFCTSFILQPPLACPVYYKWRRGDTCSSVISLFCGSRSGKTWTQCLGSQSGICVGTGSDWQVGRVICVGTCNSNTGLRVPNCFG